MSCYSDGDLIAYRLPKRRAGRGYTVFTATVQGDQSPEPDGLLRVYTPGLNNHDHVPVETIVMHQPQLLVR